MKEILTSSVIAALLSGALTLIWNFFNQRKQNSLKYITEERKLWRDDIRNIIIELENSDITNIRVVLDKIKCRINAFGLKVYFDDKNNIQKETKRGRALKDAHTWKCIFEIENIIDKNNNTEPIIIEFENKKSLLINYLCALLKHDWEKSKAEIKTSSNLIYSIISLIFGISLIFLFIHFIPEFSRYKTEEKVFYDIVFPLSYVLCYFLSLLPSVDLFVSVKPRKSMIWIFNSLLFVFIVFIYGLIYFSVHGNLVLFIIPVVLLLISIGLSCAQQIEKANVDSDYVKTVIALEHENRKTEKQEKIKISIEHTIFIGQESNETD